MLCTSAGIHPDEDEESIDDRGHLLAGRCAVLD